ncbi:MAG: hypothetical protein H6704_23515 [Myxococcales bacterium]|nr:hypothetical protein [Myxococcales bacterium]
MVGLPVACLTAIACTWLYVNRPQPPQQLPIFDASPLTWTPRVQPVVPSVLHAAPQPAVAQPTPPPVTPAVAKPAPKPTRVTKRPPRTPRATPKPAEPGPIFHLDTENLLEQK